MSAISIVGFAQKSEQTNEVTFGEPTRPDPLKPYVMLSQASKGIVAGGITSSEGCSSLETWEPILVSEKQWRLIDPPTNQPQSQIAVLPIDGKGNCIKVGEPAPIAMFDRESGLSLHLGWFFPTAIHPRRADYARQEDTLLKVAGVSTASESLIMVSGRVIFGTGTQTSGSGFQYAPRLQGARVLTRDQMEAAIARADQIVDVRLKKIFDAGHVKGAKQIPYSVGSRAKPFDTYANYPKVGDAFDIRKIDPDREKPVILMGAGFHSPEPYRAAMVLRAEGWKKIFVFAEGFEYFVSPAQR